MMGKFSDDKHMTSASYIKSSQLENRPFHLTGLPILTGSVCIILVNFIYKCILICPSNHSCFVHTFYAEHECLPGLRFSDVLSGVY